MTSFFFLSFEPIDNVLFIVNELQKKKKKKHMHTHVWVWVCVCVLNYDLDVVRCLWLYWRTKTDNWTQNICIHTCWCECECECVLNYDLDIARELNHKLRILFPDFSIFKPRYFISLSSLKYWANISKTKGWLGIRTGQPKNGIYSYNYLPKGAWSRNKLASLQFLFATILIWMVCFCDHLPQTIAFGSNVSWLCNKAPQ